MGINVEISSYGLARAAMRQLHRERRRNRGCLIQAPLWLATTAYTVGRLARLTSGLLVVCGTAGTTGASEPTYSSTGSMTDGTVTWWPYGGRKTRLNGDGYSVPTITASTTITGLSSISLIPASSPASPVAGNKFADLTCPDVRDYSGVATNAWCVKTNGAAESAGSNIKGYMRAFEFESDAPKLAIGLWNPVNQYIRVYVDGYQIEEDATVLAAGSPSYYIIDWSSVDGRRARSYRIECSGAQALRSVAVDPLSSITPPRRGGVKGLWISDSYGGTISANSGAFANNLTSEFLSESLMARLGVRWTRNLHVASTGYVNTNGGALYNALEVLQNNTARLSDWTDVDVIVVGHGFNDTAIASQDSDLGVQAQATWELLRSMFPGAFIQILGPWPASNLTGANKPAADAVLKARQAAWGDKNSAYISFLELPTPQFGSGRVGTVASNGNSDFFTGTDNTHPSIMGKFFLEDWLLPRIDAHLVAAGY